MRRTHIRGAHAFFIVFLLCLASCSQLGMEDDFYPAEDTMIQVLMGATWLEQDEIEYNLANSVDPSVVADPATDVLPTLGVSGQVPLGGDLLQYGLEGGLLLSVWGDDVDVISTDNKTYVKVNTDLITNELFFGAYVASNVSDYIRVYGGAGPMLIYGIFETDAKEADQDTSFYNAWDRTESDVALGVYVRGGVDFQLTQSTMLGLGLRAYKSDLDFNKTVGDVNVNALQAMVVYTFRF